MINLIEVDILVITAFIKNCFIKHKHNQILKQVIIDYYLSGISNEDPYT